MTEYIEREALMKYADTQPGGFISNKSIQFFQAADVAPVKHGRWEWFEEWSQSTPEYSAECDDCGYKCSECKTALEDIVNGYYDDPYEVPQLNYCPNCGAKMDEEGNNER